jgi:hypothetical protein
MQDTIVNIGLIITYIMLGIATLTAIVFPVIFLIQDPKKAKNSLFGVLGLGVIFLVAYLLSSNEVYEEAKISATVSQLVGGGIIMLYITLGIAVITAIYSEIARILK